jgi:hypothetical protein
MLICVALIVSLIAIGPNPTLVSACPVQEPVPLRKLCQESDLIVVARSVKSELVDRTRQNCRFKVEFEVSSKHKGEDSDSTIYVYHPAWVVVSLNSEPEATSSGGVKNSTFSDGETVLLFLRRREEGKDYQLTDISYGIKKLSESDREIYTQRIDEFTQILKAEKPSLDEIIEWLIRCAEQPATRVEGTYDLLYSTISELRGEKQDGRKIGNVVPVSDIESLPTSTTREEVNDNGEVITIEVDTFKSTHVQEDKEVIPLINEVIAHLTTEQRERLEGVLFSLKELDSRDLTLASVIGNWADSRVAEFLLPHINSSVEIGKKDPNKSYLTASIMQTVAEVLKDEKLKKLLDSYYGKGFFNFDPSDEEDEAKIKAKSEEAVKRLLEAHPVIIEKFIARAKKQIGQ